MTPNTELSDELRKLGFELEGVLADIDHEGLQSFDEVCERTVKRVRLRLAVLSSQLRAASPAPLREADTSTAQKINAPDAGPMPEICDGMSKSDVWAYAHLCGFRSAGIEADGDGGKGLAQLDAQWWMEHRADIIQALSDKGLQIVSNKERVWLSPTSPPNGKTEGDASRGGEHG